MRASVEAFMRIFALAVTMQLMRCFLALQRDFEQVLTSTALINARLQTKTGR
jgi:hypothetical protein